MVISPTPPGTLDMYDALSKQSSKSTSPQSFPVSGSRLTPTSIITAPCLIISFLTKRGDPIAGTRMSACCVRRSMFSVCEWTIDTVAFSSRKSLATGSPTICDRPITTTCLPRMSMPLVFISDIIPRGVHGGTQSRCCHSPATLSGWKPSMSLYFEMVSMMSSSLMCRGSGSWTSMPSTTLAALRDRTTSMSSSCDVDDGSRSSELRMPTLSAAFCLLVT